MASTLPVAGLTAWFSLVEQGHLKAGETVFLPGTGGVALFALQIAVAHGAEVIISSSSEEKLERAKALEAAHCIHRGSSDIVKVTLDITEGRGADHVLELIGGDNFKQSIEIVSPGGRISVIGLQGAKELSAPTTSILLQAPVIQGIVTGHRRALEDLVRAIDRSGLKPVVDRHYAFNDLQEALDHLQAGAFGKNSYRPTALRSHSSMLTLEKHTTALIIVDLQKGILDPEPVPFGREQIVSQAAALGHAFAQAGSPIVLTATDFAPGYADAPKGLADSPWQLPRRVYPQILRHSFRKSTRFQRPSVFPSDR